MIFHSAIKCTIDVKGNISLRIVCCLGFMTVFKHMAIEVGVTISRCCKVREKSFNRLVKRWHRNVPKCAWGEKMSHKAIFFVFVLFLCTVTLHVYGQGESLQADYAKWMFPPNFLHGFQFSVQDSFCWHGKWNSPVSSSLKLHCECNLSWQTPTWMKFNINEGNVEPCPKTAV